MVTITAKKTIGLCCANCRTTLHSHPLEKARGGRLYDSVLPVVTCDECMVSSFREALKIAKDQRKKEGK